jgi:threonine/homoserine/homoserine lactone efflux protein
MNLLLFLIQVFIISISGAMQPGPVTATAITMGARNRWAGVLLAVGHGIIEFPLMLLIILGLGSLFQKPATQITIGLIGGLVLIYMAYAMFKTSSADTSDESRSIWRSLVLARRVTKPLAESRFGETSHGSRVTKPLAESRFGETSHGSPVFAGILLTASNPYFLIWWATVGLALATRATQFGLHAFVLFAVTHWLVDLLWVTALSLAAFHGTSLLGPKSLTIILKICAAAMLLFALFFLYSSISLLIRA